MFGKKKTPGAFSMNGALMLRCSFCNKAHSEVKKLVAGPKVQICDECIDICVDVISEDKKDLPERSKVVEGHATSESTWPPSVYLFCGLCRIPTALDQSLSIPERGIVCAGCVGAFQAALAEREDTTH